MRPLHEIFASLPAEDQESLRRRVGTVQRQIGAVAGGSPRPVPMVNRRRARIDPGRLILNAALILGILVLAAGVIAYTVDEVRFIGGSPGR